MKVKGLGLEGFMCVSLCLCAEPKAEPRTPRRRGDADAEDPEEALPDDEAGQVRVELYPPLGIILLFLFI